MSLPKPERRSGGIVRIYTCLSRIRAVMKVRITKYQNRTPFLSTIVGLLHPTGSESFYVILLASVNSESNLWLYFREICRTRGSELHIFRIGC